MPVRSHRLDLRASAELLRSLADTRPLMKRISASGETQRGFLPLTGHPDATKTAHKVIVIGTITVELFRIVHQRAVPGVRR